MSEETIERLAPGEMEKLRAEYNYILELAANDPSGSILEFWTKLRKFIRDQSGGDPEAIKTFVNTEIKKVERFAGLTGPEIDAALEDVQPDKAPDVKREMDKVRLDVEDVARQRGVDINAFDFEGLVDESRRMGFDVQDIRSRLDQILEQQLSDDVDLIGSAGDNQTQLLNWASTNGLDLDAQAADAYVLKLTTGAQTFADVKQELRETYLVGAFPAWADKIREGYDPSVLVAPYKSRAANLLEVEANSLTFDDPVIKAAMQYTGGDGSPAVLPLYEYDRLVRQDARWDKTNNAYATYTKVGTDLLRRFGFR
jgi:hypothetical protein